MGLTLESTAEATVPLNFKSMSVSTTSSHGTPLLQSKTIPSLVPEVPVIFLNETWLILIFDGFCNHRRKKLLVNSSRWMCDLRYINLY